MPALLQSMLMEAFETDGRITNVERDQGGSTQGHLLKTEIREFQARYDASAEAPPTVVVCLELRLMKIPDWSLIGHILITEQTLATRNRLRQCGACFRYRDWRSLGPECRLGDTRNMPKLIRRTWRAGGGPASQALS